MKNLYRYKVDQQSSILVEIDDGQPAGGAPVAIADRIKDTGRMLTDALKALPPLIMDIKSSVFDQLLSASEISVEFGAKVGADVGLIVSKSQAEANFKVTVTWKK